jgi:hypothetical protein
MQGFGGPIGGTYVGMPTTAYPDPYGSRRASIRQPVTYPAAQTWQIQGRGDGFGAAALHAEQSGKRASMMMQPRTSFRTSSKDVLFAAGQATPQGPQMDGWQLQTAGMGFGDVKALNNMKRASMVQRVPAVLSSNGASTAGLVQAYMQKMKKTAQVERLTVCVVGSGNWGSTAAKIIGENILEGEASRFFEHDVRMWVFDEDVKQADGSVRKLSEVINTDHENVKYLPGIKLPANVKAVPDLKQAVEGAHVLIWVLPHQFIPRTASSVKDVIHPNAISVSMVKGAWTSRRTASSSARRRSKRSWATKSP